MSPDNPPLCLSLEGTLVPVDTLHEQLLALVRVAPMSLLAVPGWWFQGREVLSRQIAPLASIEADYLPYRPELLAWLRSEHANGRRLVLLTTSGPEAAAQVAATLPIFAEVIAVEATQRSTESIRDLLITRYGERGFDYAGSSKSDAVIWQASRQAIAVGSADLTDLAARVATLERGFTVGQGRVRAWLRAVRLHQWVKNALLFVPALLAHRIMVPAVLTTSVLAFLAFGLCASSIYVINDLLDLPSDRRHARKRKRPFASGTLSAKSGLLMAAVLLIASGALAILTGPQFCAVLATYMVLTWAYSLRLKRAALVDVMTLAGLYTIRIIAGAASTGIALSFWLLAFSVFIFLSLGFVKRYAELYDAVQSRSEGAGHGRGYRAADLPLLLNLGTAAGYCTVVVVALYINSAESQVLYHHHKPLWLICPVLLYWISRVWLLTTRGQMHDDPVVFAIRDRTSLFVLALLGLIAAVSV